MSVFDHFVKLTQIPRGSGNEKAVSDYVKSFAEGLGLKTIQDEWNNLVIYKNGTSGYENKKPIILQAHLDMVCEKNVDTNHDFLADPIKMYTDGDLLKAEGTTLGADNGIGVAFCMELMQDGTNHPPLEIILTTEEETGMGGAENIDVSLLKSKRMINLDSSEEDRFTMGCAAGVTIEYQLGADYMPALKNDRFYSLSVKGLKGGHSGEDINKERGNAIKILASLFYGIDGAHIAKISGGMKINAIPREAEAIIQFVDDEIGYDDDDEEILIDIVGVAKSKLDELIQDLKVQYRTSDPDLVIEFKKVEGVERILTRSKSYDITSAIILMPSGVIENSVEIKGLVNASNNIGVVETEDKYVKIWCMSRGAAELYNKQTEEKIKTLSNNVGGYVYFTQRSPAWPYDPNSELLKSAVVVYKEVFDREPIITAIHAGLECGIFSQKIEGLDIISFGPEIKDLHTPDERLSISSTNKMFDMLQKLLASL